MIEAVEYATPSQLAERRRFLEGRQRMAQNAVADIGIDLRRKIVAAAPIKPLPPIETPVQLDWVAKQNLLPKNFINHIKRTVAEKFRQTIMDIDSDCRCAEYVLPRQIAMYLCKVLTLHSLPAIGRKFGQHGRDHTTVLHSYRTISGKLLINSFICQVVYELHTQLENDLDRWRRFG